MAANGEESPADPGLTSGALARRLGVSPTTLRSWDRRYGIGPEVRGDGRHRRWSPRDVAVLEEMCRLTSAGLPPGEAARVARAGTTPLWLMLRHPLPVALGLATLAAVSPDLGGDVSLQRVLGFLPFFVLGLTLRAEHFERLRTRRARLCLLPVGLGAYLAAYRVAPWFDAGWFYHRGSVTGQGAPRWAGLLTTPALFCLAVLLTACFLAWVPRRRLWFTALGAGTMYGYLLHGFVIKWARFRDWYAVEWVHTPLGQLAVTAVAAGGITLLCTAPVRTTLRCVVEPRMEWAFRKEAAARDAGHSGRVRGGGHRPLV
ncbi:MerR family transcriptional regulator [Streptomyces scabiei]|uniref:MerR family transcriptional regulator n=1 Tax=Streptomyces scabiei TaxID=1930 RepID=UPI0029ADA86D|nr:MerR family transcriptional regulator [Streptomyces scabiei]MDX2577014.1 MerR family transcriptional regulator [Streptomyces scabiei]